MGRDFSRIPEELRKLRQWVLWRLEWKKGDVGHELKPTKIPYQINGNFADVTKPHTWTDFGVVVTQNFNCQTPCDYGTPVTLTGFTGIGFVLVKDGKYTFIDLDDTDGDETLSQQQLSLYQAMNSYSELSPSGKGLHIIVKGHVPRGKRRYQIEVYSDTRFMTMTGDVYNDAPIVERQAELDELFRFLGNGVEAFAYEGNAPQREEDAVIIERALKAVNGPKFEALYRGNWKDYYGPQFGHQGEGHSEADFALIDIISFYTENVAQIKRIFRSSQLGKREKAKRDKYIERMIFRSFDKKVPPLEIVGMQETLALQMQEAEEKRPEAFAPGQVQGGSLASGKEETSQPWLPQLSPEVNSAEFKWPPGLLGDIADFIYRSSPTPIREIAIAAAIGFMAGMAGRCYNVSGTGLNQYIICLAPTGSGKEQVATGISHLMHALRGSLLCPTINDFRGPSSIRSDAGLLKWLAVQPSIVSIIGEFGIKLKQISSPFASNHESSLRALLLDLYNKSGAGKQIDAMAYSDKEKNTAIIHNVAFSLLAESTPETFYNSLEESMITEGLLPRFTIIEYAGQQPPLNEEHELVKPDMRLLDVLSRFAGGCASLNKDNRITHLKLTPEAKDYAKQLREFARKETNNAERELVKALWSRVNMKVLKLAGLVAVGCNAFEPTIEIDHLEWAKGLIIKDTLNLLKRFESGEIGGDAEETKQERIIKKVCQDYVNFAYSKCEKYCQGKDAGALHAGKIISYVYIQRRVAAMAAFRGDPRGVTFSIQRTIRNLIDADVLREVPPSEMAKFGTRQKGYMISDYGSLTS